MIGLSVIKILEKHFIPNNISPMAFHFNQHFLLGVLIVVLVLSSGKL